MSTIQPSARKRLDWMRPAALGVALVWACWLTALGLSSGLRQNMNPGEVFMHTLFPGLVFLVGVFVAWRWALIGGIILVIEGAVSLLFYPFFVALPAVVAGILLLTWRITHP